MADFFDAIIKATKLVRRRRPFSAALAFQKAMTPSGRRPGVKRTKIASKPSSTSRQKARSSPLPRPAPGSFLNQEFTCRHGSLHYRLYTPKGSSRRRMPLIVMLHGCSQTASDFAAGTGMNDLADELGFLVLYPQQSSAANLARCWNWHSPDNQERGRGEPALIAALTRHVAALCRANPARIYIAGLSAGGAAASIIGAAYPDLYTAIGVHSGVSRGDIRSLGAALSAMRGRPGSRSTDRLPRQLPTIVFHGDKDRVVHPSNAGGFLHNIERSGAGPLISRSRSGRMAGGRDYTHRVYRDRG
ncbi:PHB depolymerase family esterase, partial [Sphingobium sp.]|uniref:extracellular catalytic domain type 1 short-chain-length polyhydroxyalkanoate depolymerase n=1 Tax=Sphingobium sp. TaxID=1912891 RepID=UPI00262E5D9A